MASWEWLFPQAVNLFQTIGSEHTVQQMQVSVVSYWQKGMPWHPPQQMHYPYELFHVISLFVRFHEGHSDQGSHLQNRSRIHDYWHGRLELQLDQFPLRRCIPLLHQSIVLSWRFDFISEWHSPFNFSCIYFSPHFAMSNRRIFVFCSEILHRSVQEYACRHWTQQRHFHPPQWAIETKNAPRR